MSVQWRMRRRLFAVGFGCDAQFAERAYFIAEQQSLCPGHERTNWHLARLGHHARYGALAWHILPQTVVSKVKEACRQSCAPKTETASLALPPIALPAIARCHQWHHQWRYHNVVAAPRQARPQKRVVQDAATRLDEPNVSALVVSAFSQTGSYRTAAWPAHKCAGLRKA